MPDLQDGETVEIQGSAVKPYILKNVGGVYSCSCPAWRNQSLGIERRTCKHLISLRGEAAERERLGQLSVATTPGASKKSVPALLLAETWRDDTDVSGWWLSERSSFRIERCRKKEPCQAARRIVALLFIISSFGTACCCHPWASISFKMRSAAWPSP